MPNAFLNDLENIGKHILSGIEKVAPIVSKFPIVSGIPVVGPILLEVSTIITQLEESGTTITPAEIEQIITTIASAATLKAAASNVQPTVTVTKTVTP
jgi:hypothetical protein